MEKFLQVIIYSLAALIVLWAGNHYNALAPINPVYSRWFWYTLGLMAAAWLFTPDK